MSWRRIVLLSVILVAVLGGATWTFLQRSDAATQIVRRELAALFRTPTAVAATELDLGLGRLTARGVRIDDPRRAGQALLALERIDVDVAVASGGSFVDVHAVTIDGLELEGGPDLPTLAELLVPKSAKADSEAPRVPPVTVRRGRVRAVVQAGQPPVEIVDLALALRPAAGSDRLVLTGDARIPELGATLALGGDLDVRTGAGTLTATVRGGKLDDALLTRVTALLGVAKPSLAASATVQSLQVTATLAAGDAPHLTAAVELTDVRVSGAELPAIVTAGTVALRADDRDGGTVSLHLVQANANGTLDVVAKATNVRTAPEIDVRVHGTDIAIDAEVVKALRLFDTGREVVEALHPTAGRADLDLFLRNPQRRGGIAELDLMLREVAITFHGFGKGDDKVGFPLPMENARGRVRLRNDVVLLEDVHAQIAERAGGGTVRLLGRIDGHQAAGEDAAIDIRAENVAFHADLRDALGKLLHDGGALYDRLAPTGRTEVEVRVRPRSELPGGWQVEVRPSAATMQWAGFPYRLEALTGNVRAREDGVAFDLAGRHGAGSLAMRGFIPLTAPPDEARSFVANVELDAITIDDELRAAVAVIAPGLDALWRSAAPSGRFRGQVKVWRPRPQDDLQHDARIEIAELSLALPAAPWRAEKLQGQVLVQGFGADTRVDFDALRGELGHGSATPAKLALLGNLTVGKNSREELAFVVRDLELDEQLGRTLEALDALGPGTWTSLAPSGRVDLVCRHHRDGGGTADPLQLVVHLLDVRSDAPMLLRPAEHMTGELTIKDRELRFDDVRAVLGGAAVTATAGRVRARPAPDLRTEIAFTVNALGVPIDDGVANLFSGPLHTAVLQRQLFGRADVDSLRLTFALPNAHSTLPFETGLDGQLRLYDLDMTLGTGIDGIVVQGINGVVRLAPSTVSDTGGGLSGALSGVSLDLFGQPLEGIDATFVADAHHLAVGALRSTLHGGLVRSARPDAPGIDYLLPGPEAPEGRLAADLVFENVDVYTFLEHGGWQNPPYTGAAKGALVLERLDGSKVLDAQGHGTLQLDRADLGVVPLFTAIYAQLPASDRPRFDGLACTWKVKDRTVDFERFDVHSSILAAAGKGKLDFDGYLSVELKLEKLLGASADPFVMPLIAWLAENIVTFYLHGYLRDLHADKSWFGNSEPRRREVLPMPPARPQTTAPKY